MGITCMGIRLGNRDSLLEHPELFSEIPSEAREHYGHNEPQGRRSELSNTLGDSVPSLALGISEKAGARDVRKKLISSQLRYTLHSPAGSAWLQLPWDR